MKRLFLLGIVACTQDFNQFYPRDGSTSDTTGDATACALTYGGHCYTLIAAQNWQNGQTACNQTGAHLVTLESMPEQLAVQALGSGDRWIGLSRTSNNPTDANYQWITGEARNGYANWGPGAPSGTGKCGRLLASNLWDDDLCTNTHPAICEHE